MSTKLAKVQCTSSPRCLYTCAHVCALTFKSHTYTRAHARVCIQRDTATDTANDGDNGQEGDGMRVRLNDASMYVDYAITHDLYVHFNIGLRIAESTAQKYCSHELAMAFIRLLCRG